MKVLRHLLELVSRWVAKCGWAIFTFLLGIIFGLLMTSADATDRNFAITVVTAIGTIGAAGAALWTTRLSHETLDRQLSHEQGLKQPNLRLSDIKVEQKGHTDNQFENGDKGRKRGAFRLHIELTNLGEFPIYVVRSSTSNTSKLSDLLFLSSLQLVKADTNDEYENRGFLVPPNTSVRRMFDLDSDIPSYNEAIDVVLTFFFEYGPTAKKLHQLELTYKH